MRKLNSRLAAVEGSMTPKQFLLQLIDEVNATESKAQHTLESSSNSAWTKTTDKLDAIFEGMEKRLKDRKLSQDIINTKVRKAQETFQFLFHLYLETSRHVADDKYKHLFKGLYCATLLPRVVRVMGDVSPEQGERFTKTLQDIHLIGTGHLFNLYSQQKALDYLSKEYFDGRDILHPEDRHWFDQAISVAERFSDTYNDLFEESPFAAYPQYKVQVELALTEADAQFMGLVEGHINTAKISVWSADMRTRDKAMKLIQEETLKWAT